MGPAGPVGRVGQVGPSGRAGTPGARGPASGPRGESGQRGESGTPGVAGSTGGSDGSSLQTVDRVRTQFSETWMWTDRIAGYWLPWEINLTVAIFLLLKQINISSGYRTCTYAWKMKLLPVALSNVSMCPCS